MTREESGPALLGQGDGCVQACSASILQTGYRGWIFSETPYYSQRLRRNGEDCVCLARQDRTALENMFGGKERGNNVGRFKFAVCEWSFPCWGELAIKMAYEAGFDGVQLGDGGGSMHAYPLRDRRVQEYYLQAGSDYHISFPQIHLYTLGHQCYYRSRLDTLEGQTCLESIKQGVIAASEMGCTSVIIDGMRMNNAAKRQHIFQVAQYAVRIGEEYGIQIGMETDMSMEDHISFLDALDGKLKLCFDAHNPVMYGTGYPPDMIRTLGKDRIDHFHVKESQANEDGFLSVETPIVLLGEGCTFLESPHRR